MIIRSNNYNRAVPRVLLAGAVLFAFTSMPGWAQAHPAQHPPTPAASQDQPSSDQSLADQVQQLREQINQLQETIRQQGTQRSSPRASTPARPAPAQGMAGGTAMAQGPMGEMSGMPMQEMGMMMQEMGKPMQEMGMKMQETGMNMQQTGMNMEKMGMEKMGMGEMGAMPGMTGSSSTASGTAAMGNMSSSSPAARQTTARSALPGFPGASHLYHIGSTGFFLDHPEHISVSAEQKTRLSQIKEKATLDNTAAQRKIDEAEQKLWTLTASDQPDQAAIAAQVKTIEGLRADQRLAYIRAVGEAAQVLTDQQRQTLLGKVPMSASK